MFEVLYLAKLSLPVWPIIIYLKEKEKRKVSESSENETRFLNERRKKF